MAACETELSNEQLSIEHLKTLSVTCHWTHRLTGTCYCHNILRNRQGSVEERGSINQIPSYTLCKGYKELIYKDLASSTQGRQTQH